MKDLYPDPPHLTMAIYSSRSEAECFGALWRVVEGLGCSPSGTVQVAPWDAVFELRSDLAHASAVVKPERNRFSRIVAGLDEVGRPIFAGYRRKGIGTVLVEYLASPAYERHPIAVSISAGALGIPGDLWQKPDRLAVKRLAKWTKGLLFAARGPCAALYGRIGIEYGLSTPQALANGNGSVGSQVFLCRDLVESSPEMRAVFEMDFQGGDIVEWPTGWFYSGWAPFTSRKITLPSERISHQKAGVVLGRAALRRNM